MTSLTPQLTAPLAPVHAGRVPPWYGLAIWLAAAAIGVFFAVLLRDSTVVDGAYLPRANDSFYHARRILDAAVGERGFYQFDERLHAPDGSWIPWPWAYDYLMAKAAQLALFLVPSVDAALFIFYVPVAWLLVNAALFLAAARAAGLSPATQLLALLSFAISPLTQLLHSIGMVDHHYVEHTFVLLAIWLGLRWFQAPGEPRRAVFLGITLGLAQAFHNGLFILQLLPLATVFVLWLRRAEPPLPAMRGFAVALVVTTQLILLPSEPYRAGLFEFGLLSWFHFYVAICTAAAIVFMSWHGYSRGSLLGLVSLSLILVAPLAGQLLGGAGFLTGSFSVLNQVIEVNSPYKLFTQVFGPTQTASYYSWLLLATPALLAWFAYRALRERQPEHIYYAVVVVFGLCLLLAQFRLHYFGFFALVTAPLLLADRLCAQRAWHRGACFAAMLAMVAAAYQPALRERLFLVYAPGGDTEYAAALPIFRELGRLCAEDSGVVLANSDDGSPIIFHSECSVIANNFILRQEDQAHIDEIGRLMRLTPAEIRAQRPDIKYLFVRAASFSLRDGDTQYFVEEAPIAKQLFIDSTPPPGFTLLHTIARRVDSRPDSIYARLYKIDQPARPRAPPQQSALNEH